MNNSKENKPESNKQRIKRRKEAYHSELLHRIEELNKEAYNYYLKKRFELSEYYLRRELWKSEIWNKAKTTYMEINILINGILICQFCNQEIEDTRLRNFQLHHKHTRYDWENPFSPEEIQITHKSCHKKLHNNQKEKQNNKKRVDSKT